MPRSTNKVYWDACLFIDLVNETPTRFDILEALFDELAKPNPTTVGVTSTLTIAEVAFASTERENGIINDDVLKRIDGFWSPSSPIELVELYSRIAIDARALIRDAVGMGLSLKAHDAIHFATAQRRGVSRFLTFDKKLLHFSATFGFAVQEPRSDTLPFSRARK